MKSVYKLPPQSESSFWRKPESSDFNKFWTPAPAPDLIRGSPGWRFKTLLGYHQYLETKNLGLVLSRQKGYRTT
jgi:hypothetical protein